MDSESSSASHTKTIESDVDQSGGQDTSRIDLLDGAIAGAVENLPTQPDDEMAWYTRGEALAKAEHYVQALECFNRVIELNPDHGDTWVYQAVVLIHLERYQDVLASCDRALALKPNHAEAWMFRGVALHRLGRYKLAYASYERATATDQPED